MREDVAESAVSEMRRVFSFGSLAVTVEYSEHAFPDGQEERGARVEIREMEGGRPGRHLWRADLLRSAGHRDGRHDRGHYHPRFRGWKAGPRHWSAELARDPVGWTTRQLEDVERVLEAAGGAHLASAAEAGDVREALPTLREGIESCLTLPPELEMSVTRPVIPIREDGNRTPLFFATTGYSGIVALEPVARALGPDRPLFGLPTSPWADLPEVRSVGDIAQRLLAEVRTAQPEGPYLLAGYSFGGLVAFEMARRLRQEGAEVGFLLLVDAVCLRGLPRAVRRARLRTRTRETAAALLPDAVALPLRWARDRLRGVPPRPRASAAVRRGERLDQRVGRRRTKRMRLTRSYTPGVYGGSMSLLWTRYSVDRYVDPLLGWGGVVEGPIHASEVPGTHGGLVLEDLAAPVGNQVAEHLSHARPSRTA